MSDFDTLIRASARSPRVKGSITFATGVTKELAEKDILGFNVHEGVSDGMLLGAAISASCSVTLSGAGGAWLQGGDMRGQNPLVGAYVKLSLTLDGTNETRDICAFYVSAVQMAENDARVTLSGADALSTAFNTPFTDDQTYPRTLAQIAEYIAAQAGFAIDTDFINAGVSIAATPDWGDISLRGAMGYVACAAAAFARIGRDGTLALVPVYDRQTAYVLPAQNTLSHVYGEIALGAIAAVVVTPKGRKSEQVDVTYALDGAIATDGNALRIRNNPLFPANGAHNAALASGVLAAVLGMTLTRAQASWQGDPSLTVGRRLKIIDHEGNETMTSVTRQNLSYDNGFSMTSDCTLRSAYDAGAGLIVNSQGGISASRLTGEMDGGLVRAGTIAAASIVAGSITAAQLAAGSIGAEQIAANAVTADKIMSGAITTAKIAANAITAESGVIADAAIGTAQIDNASITSVKIADAAVSTAKIADAAITHAKLGSAAVGTANIKTGAITTALIGTGAVETAQIADGSITDAKIVSLTANKLTAGTIDASVISVNNLTADNITTGTINGQRIPTLGTEKLADGAVTGDKVAPNAITADKIVTGAVTTDKLAANAVTANKIAANAVTAGKIEAGAVKAEHIEAGAVTAAKIADIDGALNIVSGGSMNIASGDFLLRAGSQAGEYLGISSTGETTIFTGAENAAGDNPKFSLSKYGEASMRDANISGEIEVMGAMTLGEGVTVEFRDAAARYNFLRAMAGGDALPYNMGGTNAATRENAMRNMSLMVGMDEPSAMSAQNIGDRYLLVKPGTTTAANTVTMARSGYYQTKQSNQKRLKTVITYVCLDGDPRFVPSNTTTYSSWSDTGIPTYGDLTAATSAYCYETSGTESGRYSGSTTTTTGVGSRGSGDTYSEWSITTKKTYEYRTYTRTVYFASMPAPTAGTGASNIKSNAVKTANLSITTDATENATYTLSIAQSADGQTGKALIATATGAGAVAFNVLDSIPDMYASARYLVLERAGSSAAVTVTAATLSLTYYSGARRTEEYVWNGNEWRPLALGSDNFFDETTDATVAVNDYVFTVPITDGGEGAKYEFEFLGKPNTNTTTRFVLCLNNDNVYANYRSRVTYGANVYSERARIGDTGSTTVPTFAHGTVSVLGGYITVTGQGMWASQNTAFSVVYGNGTTNLTAINIRMESAAAGVGCRMKVKRA